MSSLPTTPRNVSRITQKRISQPPTATSESSTQKRILWAIQFSSCDITAPTHRAISLASAGLTCTAMSSPLTASACAIYALVTRGYSHMSMSYLRIRNWRSTCVMETISPARLTKQASRVTLYVGSVESGFTTTTSCTSIAG